MLVHVVSTHFLLLQALKLSLGVAEEFQTFFCVYQLQDGWGTANTALIYHANKLLALHEADLPYAVSPSLLLASCWLGLDYGGLQLDVDALRPNRAVLQL